MFDSVSGAEKIGWLGLMGGIFVAGIQALKWIANFGEEHRLLMENLTEAKAIVPRFLQLEESAKIAREERREMLEELRGLRKDINDALKIMASRGGRN